MTKDQINAAIAEIMESIDAPDCWYTDYTTDLNAIHAAWKTLTHDEKMFFQNYAILDAIDREEYIYLLGIEALPRCKAFLKTKGKWTE